MNDMPELGIWMAYWGSEPSLQLFRRRRLLNILFESVIETMLFHFSLFTRLTVLEMREGREAYHAKHNAQYTALFYFPFWSAHVSKRHNYTSANAISRIVHIYTSREKRCGLEMPSLFMTEHCFDSKTAKGIRSLPTFIKIFGAISLAWADKSASSKSSGIVFCSWIRYW